MRVIPALLMTCALFLDGWMQPAWGDQFRLDSGKIVDIIAVKAVKSIKGPVLKLEYRSKTPITDVATLRKEADELWDNFSVNVERGGHKYAVIRALGPNKAIPCEPVDFIFVKLKGDWHTLEYAPDPKESSPKLY